MNVAYRHGSAVRFRDEKELPLQADEIRIRVDACGICGTDLHPNEQEERFGHEMAGTIVELGAHITHLTRGQQVAIDSATPCGRCENCRNARKELCSDIQSFFLRPSHFGFAETTNVPAISAIPIEGVPPTLACLQEPLGVAIDMVRLAEIGRNSNVLLTGAGPIGLMAAALAKRSGVRRLFVADLSSRPKRLELARDFGADDVIAVDQTAIQDFDFGCRIDRILVTSPPRTLSDMFASATKGAIISFIGIALGDGALCEFDANAFHFKKLQLRASFASPALFGAQAVKYLRECVVDGERLISHQLPLRELQQGLTIAKEDPEAVKVVIRGE